MPTRCQELVQNVRQYNLGSPFERIAVDIAGPFPVTENPNKYIMVVVSDYFSKWPEAYAIRNQEATTVATTLIDNWITRFGVPMELQSDKAETSSQTYSKGLLKY